MGTRSLSLFALIVAASLSVCSQAKAQGYGLGVKTCGEFANRMPATQRRWRGVLCLGRGLLSGLNFVAEAQKLPRRTISGGDESMTSYKFHIRDFCDQHPLAPYYGAVLDLYIELPPAPTNSN